MKIVYNTLNARIFVVFLLIVCFSVKCDLPVHCKREKIEGNWVFKIDHNRFTPSLKSFKTTCGHGFPDKIEQTVGDIDFKFEKYQNDIRIKLGSDYLVYEDGKKVGKWTPVYDEGFILWYKKAVITAFMKYYLKKKGDKKHVSNCNKTMIGWYIPNSEEKDKNWSCFFGYKTSIEKTMNFGMKSSRLASLSKSVKNKEKKNKLFIQKTEKNSEKSESNSTNLAEEKKVEKISSSSSTENTNQSVETKSREKSLSKGTLKTSSKKKDSVFRIINVDLKDENNVKNSSEFLQLQESARLASNSKLSTKMSLEEKTKTKYEDQKDIIEELNSMGLSWTAGLHEEFKGMSLLELNEHVGIKRKGKNKKSHKQHKKKKSHSSDESLTNKHKNYQKFKQVRAQHNVKKEASSEREQDGVHVKDFKEIKKYYNHNIKDINEQHLPKNWDWTNIGGKDFTYVPVMQGKCGSCYVFSTVGSLQARKNILTDLKDKTIFSRQFPLSCSFYTEGCKGGYPILVAKFAHEFELVEESCMPYKGKDVKCSKVCDYSKAKKKYTVSKYGYLGGFYGNTTEVDMMKEIRARGPIPGNITLPWTFSYYKQGIYTHSKIYKKNAGKLSKVTMFSKRLSWEKVDHSILLVGWGEENGVKYWKGMNTWGLHWGEHGFFKILRGENELGIESMGDFFNIKIEDRN